jgi:hypothetical protein
VLTIAKFLLFSLGLVPLVVLPLTPYPYVLGKTLAMRTAIELSLVFGLIALARYASTQALPDRQSWDRLLRSRLFIATVGFYVLSTGIGTVLAPSFLTAFFGSAIHGEGYISILHYVTLAVLVSVLFSRHERDRLIVIFVCSCATLGVFAWLQYFGFGWPRSMLPRTDQPGSFLGNPAFLASFLILCLGMVGILIKERVFARAGSWILGIVAGFFVATIFLTGIRGAVVGLAAGGFSTAALLVLSRATARATRAACLCIALSLLGLSVLFFATRDAHFWSTIPGGNRFTQLSLESPSVAARLISWRVSFNAWREKPVLGWGVEHYHVGYNRHYDPAYELYVDNWFDRAHNKIAEVAVTQGLVGLLLYAAFIAVLLSRSRRNPWLFGAMVAYLVQNLFLFDTIASYLALFVIIGHLLGSELQDAGGSPKADPASRAIPHGTGKMTKWAAATVAAVAAVAVCFHLLFHVYLPLRQAYAFSVALNSSNGEGVLRDSGKYLYPYNHFQRDLRAVLADKLVVEQIVSSDRLYASGQGLLAALEETAILAGHDPRRYVRLAELPVAISSHDASHLGQALKFAENALDLARNRLSIRYFYAFLLSKAHRFDESVRFMRETVDLLPRSYESHYHLGINAAHAASAQAGTPSGDSFRVLASDAMQTAWTVGKVDGFRRFTYGDLRGLKTLFIRFDKLRLAAEVFEVMIARDPSHRQIYLESISVHRALRDAGAIVDVARRMQMEFRNDKALAKDLEAIIDLARQGNWAALDRIYQ